jgi:hypothetical protein
LFSPEQLFIRDVDSLQEIVANPSASNLLNASAILRRLLMDASPLLHRANIENRLKIRFTITHHDAGELLDMLKELSLTDSLVFVSAGHCLEPDTPSKYPPKQVTLDQFLATPVEHVRGHTFSVGDLIRYVANHAGGVHKSVPDSDAMKVFESLATTTAILGQPAGLQTLLSICRIVLKGVEPLYDALRV